MVAIGRGGFVPPQKPATPAKPQPPIAATPAESTGPQNVKSRDARDTNLARPKGGFSIDTDLTSNGFGTSRYY